MEVLGGGGGLFFVIITSFIESSVYFARKFLRQFVCTAGFQAEPVEKCQFEQVLLWI